MLVFDRYWRAARGERHDPLALQAASSAPSSLAPAPESTLMIIEPQRNHVPITRSLKPLLLIALAALCPTVTGCASQYFDAPRLAPGECKVDARLLCRDAAYPPWFLDPAVPLDDWARNRATLWMPAYYEVPSGDVIDLHCAISTDQERLINAIAQPEVLPASAGADWLRTHDMCKAFGL